MIAQTGALKGKTRRALDSTVLDDAVATQDTVTQLIAAVRRVRREVPGAARGRRAGDVSAHDYDDPGKPRIAWNDKQARDALVDALVRDALAVLAALPEQPTWTGGRRGRAARVDRRAGRRAHRPRPRQEDPDAPPRWRIARQVAPDRVISVVDPDARHAHKTVHRRQDGFKAHVAVEPDTGLVTACRLSKASGADSSDATVGVDLLTDETEHVEVLADSAYGSGAARATLAEAGHTALIKPIPLRAPVPGGFTADDFNVDHTARTVTCPNGLTRTISPSGTATFGVACRGCPLRARCTTARDGRALQVSEHDALLRAPAATPRPTRSPSPTGSTGRWSNGPSPGSSEAATAKSATAASPRTTCGSTTASPASTCADCSTSASTTSTEPGHWPKRPVPTPQLRARSTASPRTRRQAASPSDPSRQGSAPDRPTSGSPTSGATKVRASEASCAVDGVGDSCDGSWSPPRCHCA